MSPYLFLCAIDQALYEIQEATGCDLRAFMDDIILKLNRGITLQQIAEMLEKIKAILLKYGFTLNISKCKTTLPNE